MPKEHDHPVPERPLIEAEEILAIKDLVADLGKPEIMVGAWR